MSETRPRLVGQTASLDAQVTVDRLPAVAAAGVVLIKIVLAMVMASVVLLAAYLLAADMTEGTALSAATAALLRQAAATPDQLGQLAEITRQVAGERAAFRAFWLQVAQLVLLNLLLPLLTALLGYIFGTSRAGGREE